jgi:hypothetical protein
MSILVNGFFDLHKMSSMELINFSFETMRLACEHKIGLCLGENALVRDTDKRANYLSFQMSDDPLNKHCDYLFSGDGVKLLAFGAIEPRSESLEERLNRVKTFFEQMFATRKVEKIILNIDYYNKNDFVDTNIRISEFVPELTDLYRKCFNRTPTVRYIIRKA